MRFALAGTQRFSTVGICLTQGLQALPQVVWVPKNCRLDQIPGPQIFEQLDKSCGWGLPWHVKPSYYWGTRAGVCS